MLAGVKSGCLALSGRTLSLAMLLSLTSRLLAQGNEPQVIGVASWYGEEHRGRLMANGKKFDPDKLTAASWSYPLGTRVLVTVQPPSRPQHRVVVTITDRGPAREFVQQGRIIDLALASFKRLADPQRGVVAVTVQPLP
jgi:rare lipoprotein A